MLQFFFGVCKSRQYGWYEELIVNSELLGKKGKGEMKTFTPLHLKLAGSNFEVFVLT
jgi:hypothetical protein